MEHYPQQYRALEGLKVSIEEGDKRQAEAQDYNEDKLSDEVERVYREYRSSGYSHSDAVAAISSQLRVQHPERYIAS